MTDIYQLDGQQLIAKKKSFAYPRELETARRHLAQLVDLLKSKEAEEINKLIVLDQDILSTPYDEVKTEFQIYRNVFIWTLDDLQKDYGYIKHLAREPSFNELLSSLHSFNYEFWVQAMLLSKTEFSDYLFTGKLFSYE